MKQIMTDKQFSSGNFYEVLGVAPNASQSEIKKMYQALVLKYHPDKYDATSMRCSSDEAKDYFYLIDEAWKILGDSKTRSEYDAMLRDDELYQDGPVDAGIKLSEMEFDEDFKQYTWPCRCGGSYEVTDEILTCGENFIGCTTCSLTIKVLYKHVDK